MEVFYVLLSIEKGVQKVYTDVCQTWVVVLY